MEGRCDVCRSIRTVLRGVYSTVGMLQVCDGCKAAVNRVAALEQREQVLVNALVRLGRERPELYEQTDLAVKSAATTEINRTARLVEALRAFLQATRTSQGGFSGHTLEQVPREGQTPLWACVMPGCAVCAARGIAEAALGKGLSC